MHCIFAEFLKMIPTNIWKVLFAILLQPQRSRRVRQSYKGNSKDSLLTIRRCTTELVKVMQLTTEFSTIYHINYVSQKVRHSAHSKVGINAQRESIIPNFVVPTKTFDTCVPRIKYKLQLPCIVSTYYMRHVH